MVKFNGMPMSYGMNSLDEIPLVNSVYAVVSLSGTTRGKTKYKVEYEDDKFALYNFATSSEKDAMKYMFCIQNMYPFHTFVYNRHSNFKNYQQLSGKFVYFMQLLAYGYSPLSIIAMPMLGRRESYGIWKGEVDIGNENGGKYTINNSFDNIADILQRLDCFVRYTGRNVTLINIPWYMDKLNPDVAPYANAISVIWSKYYDIENNDYKGTVMWTDGMSFFHDNVVANMEDSFNHKKDMIIEDIRNIYGNRKLHVHKRYHYATIDSYLPKEFVESWTGCNFDLIEMLKNDRLHK